MTIPSTINDISHLPKSVRDIAEALGLALVIKLVEEFGGVELRIPHTLKPGHDLMRLGIEYAEALCTYCPADTILVPLYLDRKRMGLKVRQLEQSGFKRWQIARELGITQRHVRRLANTSQDDPNQISLFD